MPVNVIDVDALAWESVPNEWAAKVPDGDPGVRFKMFSTGARAVPAGQLVDYEPGHVEAPHSHDESEIYLMLSGELTIGDVHVGPGMLVYIETGTVYGPSTTERGCRFLRLGFAE